MPGFLWTFANNNTGTTSTVSNSIALPTIQPAGSTGSGYNASTTTSQVNVVRDYYWTYSPVGDTARAEVPRIILTERKLRTNALISQLKYSLGQTTNGYQQTVQNLQQFGQSTGATAAIQGANCSITQFISNLSNTAVGQAFGQAGSVISGGVRDATNAVESYAANSDSVQQLAAVGSKAATQVVNAVGTALADDNNSTVNNSPWLAPYRNLYLTDPTGWVYVLPYFNNNSASQQNNFADDGKTGVLSDAALGIGAKAVNEAAGFFASLNSPTQITYIEKAKFYNYPTEGESITVDFPLINTGNVTYDDVVKNWQFLFLLLYQNRPGKTGNNVVDQPVIYQVEVPGTKFFPFCCMESINIEFMGSRRELVISVPTSTSLASNVFGDTQSVNNSSGATNILAVIPDAYKVTITLKSMIANSKNFMQHMITNNNIVQTSTASAYSNIASTINALANNIETGLVNLI